MKNTVDNGGGLSKAENFGIGANKIKKQETKFFGIKINVGPGRGQSLENMRKWNSMEKPDTDNKDGTLLLICTILSTLDGHQQTFYIIIFHSDNVCTYKAIF